MKTTVFLSDFPLSSYAIDGEGGYPVVIDGLTVTSGRDNPLDQPEASAARIVMRAARDDLAAQMLKLLTPNAPIRIESTYQCKRAAPVHQPTRYLSSGQALNNAPTTFYTAAPVSLWLAPLAWQKPGTNSAAWDIDNPRVAAGTPMRVALTVGGPNAARVFLTAVPAPSIMPGAPAAPVPRTGTSHNGIVAMPDIGHPAIRIDLTPPTWREARGTWQAATPTWQELGTYNVGKLFLLSPAGTTETTTTVFTGTLSSWTAQRESGATEIEIHAVDIIARLQRAMIGAQPRPRETVTDRIKWAISQTGIDIPLLTSITRNPVLEVLDVDHRSALDVIHEAARSAALSVWPAATRTGAPALYLEDADDRPASDTLTVDDAGIPSVTVISETQLDTALINRAGVEITRTNELIPSQCRVEWETVTDTGDGNRESEHHSVLTGSPGGSVITLETALTREEDALATAAAYLRRAPVSGWSIDGITIDTARQHDLSTVARLIGLNTRCALPVTLAGIPAWIPAAPVERFTVEGATLTHRGGNWKITATLTRPNHVGKSITWAELPPQLTWATTTLTWAQTAGLTIRKE